MSLSTTEKNCAQIEKEALSITWPCDKFSDYILGKHILIETDHTSLVPLFSTTYLDNLPLRVLSPTDEMYTSDTLS